MNGVIEKIVKDAQRYASGTRIGQLLDEMLVEQQRTQAARRVELARALEARKAVVRDEKERTELQIRKAGDEVGRAEKALERAYRKVAELQRHARALESDVETRRLERQLRAMVDPAIDAARRRLEDRVAEMTKTGITADEIANPKPRLGGARFVARSNERAVNACLAAIREARHRLEVLKFEPIEDVSAAVGEIESSIPWSELATMEIVGDVSSAA